jgi:hypothetical protein
MSSIDQLNVHPCCSSVLVQASGVLNLGNHVRLLPMITTIAMQHQFLTNRSGGREIYELNEAAFQAFNCLNWKFLLKWSV